MKKNGIVLWGLVFIILGIFLALRAFGIFEFNIFFDGFWTLFIIVPCFIDLCSGKNFVGNLIGILIGVFLLLACQGLIDYTILWKLFLPIVLVIVGLSLIFKDGLSKKLKKEMKSLNIKDNREYLATFSSQKLDFANEKFTNCELTAVFGGIKFHLEKSEFQKAYIKANAIFGGVTIFVPRDCLVKVVSTSIFGGVTNKKSNGDSDKVLYIEATCLFGGIEIK